MDIEHLIDRLEELFSESIAIPFSNNVIVNEDRMLDMIDQMRVSIPEEIKKAQELLNKRDRILAQAKEQAARIIQQARQEAEELVARDNITTLAQEQAAQIIAEAEKESQIQKQEADDYTLSTLEYLEGELQRLLKQAQDGILYLQQKDE